LCKSKTVTQKFTIKILVTDKIADLSQEFGTEIDKIKIIQNMAKDASFIESDKTEISQTTYAIDEKFGKDHFSLRTQIFHIERKLKSEIQQRTGILAKAQQSELFNIREVLRNDRKKLSKVTEVAENTHRETQIDINKLRAQIKKEKIQENEKSTKMNQELMKQNNEIEHKVNIKFLRKIIFFVYFC